MTNVEEAAFGRLLAGITRAYAQSDVEYLKKEAETANVDTLRRMFGFVLEGKIEEFAALLTEDIEFELTGLPAWNGRAMGREAVIAAIGRNFATVANQEPVIRSLVAQGEEIALFIEERGTVRATQEAYHLYAVQWFTFRGGKIARIREVVGAIA